MSAPVPSTRRLAIAIATAAASVTVAIGVTAASLLGWIRPATTEAEPPPEVSASMPATAEAAPAAASPVILVPITPSLMPPAANGSEPVEQLAMAVRGEDRNEDTDTKRRHLAQLCAAARSRQGPGQLG